MFASKRRTIREGEKGLVNREKSTTLPLVAPYLFVFRSNASHVSEVAQHNDFLLLNVSLLLKLEQLFVDKRAMRTRYIYTHHVERIQADVSVNEPHFVQLIDSLRSQDAIVHGHVQWELDAGLS